ncbi:MAG: CdaR family protein [Clostridia bacterium]|nr:CdaR family protein [Clostridia bacterium]
MKNKNLNTSHHLLRGIRNFFSQEPLWKLFSLVAAVLMWFIVMNTINPTEVKTFTASVTFENMEALTDKGYIVSNFPDIENFSVSIKVEGTRPALDELSKSENKNKIKAKIDLSKLDINESDSFPKTYSMGIVPSLPGSLYVYNYDIASYYPAVCDVEIDKSATSTVPVEFKTYGSPASGYTAGSPVSDIKEVQVTGPQQRISSVEKVVATVDISGEKSNMVKECTMVVYDGDDLPLEGFLITPESIPVSVEIRKNSTVKIEEPRTTGDLPDHLELLSLDWSPKSINVTSQGEAPLESISLPPVDLTKITKDTTKVVDISEILENANLEASSSQKKVTVTLKVGVKSAEEYVIEPSSIDITGLGLNLDVKLPDKITVEIGGPDDIDVNSLLPRIDLTGLGEGRHSVPLKLNLPQDAVINGEVMVDVTITKRASVPEDSTETENESFSGETNTDDEVTENTTAVNGD